MGGDADKVKISGIVDVSTKKRRFVFDMPGVTMQSRRMALDLPQTTVNTRKMSWDEPVTVMRRTKTGQKPEFTCKGFLKCKVKWTDIYMDLPTIEMRRREIAMGIPEFKMNRTDFRTDIPEITMKRVSWEVDIPEITLRNPMLEAEKLKDRGEALGMQADALASRIEGDTAQSSADLFGCYRDDMLTKRSAIAAQFDTAIQQIEAGIGAVGGAGGDPSKVASDTGPIDLIAQRGMLVKQRSEALAALDAALADLEASQKKTVETVIS